MTKSRGFLEEAGEFGLIRYIAELHPDRSKGVLLGIGDDAAEISFDPGMSILAAADVIVEGIHFHREHYSPEQVGRKAVAVNLSDMAAMGGRGRFILCQTGLPPGTDLEFFRRCTGGMVDYTREMDMALVGGDISATEGPLFLAVTILGEVPEGRIIRRSGASPGDLLLISGFPGESAAGMHLLKKRDRSDRPALKHLIRRHLEIEPRLEVARLAAGSGAVTAGIDLSDGLSSDLLHICRASGTAAEIEELSIPLSAELKEGADFLGLDPLDLALNGGEDFELLLAVSPGAAWKLLEEAEKNGQKLTAIGRVTESSPRLVMVTPGGKKILGAGGFDHFG
jgi:thiamine-monophosphate kinase